MSGRGTAALATYQKTEPSGPPFPVTAADNGLSVDPATGHIVLGGDVATPSVLLNNRFIDTAGFVLTFQQTGSTISSAIRSNFFAVIDASVPVVSSYSSTGVNVVNNATGNGSTYGDGQWVLSNTGSPNSIRCFVNDFIFFDNVTVGNRIHLRRVADVLQFTPDSFVPMFTFGITSGNFLATGSVTTGAPLGAAAPVRLGGVIAAVSVLDAANYWEVMIGGVVKKVGLIV